MVICTTYFRQDHLLPLQMYYQPRFNIAPTQLALDVFVENGRLVSRDMQWEFKLACSKSSITKAQRETPNKKPTFIQPLSAHQILTSLCKPRTNCFSVWSFHSNNVVVTRYMLGFPPRTVKKATSPTNVREVVERTISEYQFLLSERDLDALHLGRHRWFSLFLRLGLLKPERER